jgi:dCTP deaminase
MSRYGMITPWEEGVHRPNKISYGITSYGYDMRVSNEWSVFAPDTPSAATVIDPKTQTMKSLMTNVTADFIDIAPNNFVLCRSVEYFRIPRTVGVIVIGKSTYARCGLIVNVTPLEPEWEGHVTIELSNTTPYPIRVYAFEGIAQCMFIGAEDVCEISYADKKGKYQHQIGIQHPMVK